MVYGNYVLYGDRPSSESEIVDDHVHSRSIERKFMRKTERRMNGCLERNPSIDNETDSAKYEKKVHAPRLLRYVPTSDIEETYVGANKFETYDLKASEQPLRRHTFTKKPKNPLDGSTNYAYSRSSSGCSSPASNLPTISENGEPSLHRVRSSTSAYDEAINVIEHKLDKYFTKPDAKDFVAKGTHPDSLFRVSAGYTPDRNKMLRWLRVMRWPIALIATCIALAVFVYFLMPDTMDTGVNVNGTYWEDNTPESHLYRLENEKREQEPTTASSTTVNNNRINIRGSKTPEIDFYHTTKTIDFKKLKEAVTESNNKRKLSVAPVFPDHLAPEVVYGNEKVDTERLRKSKILQQQTIPDDSTLRPHITQKPEKPLAIYFKEEGVISTTTKEPISSSESIAKYPFYESKVATKKPHTKEVPLAYPPIYKDRRTIENASFNKQANEPEVKSYSNIHFPSNFNFTSGHSKIFGISIEHAEKMKATTPSSVYQTRVSPTLPTWRDQDTTTKFASNFYADVAHCKSPQQHLCRGVLPYDLSGEPLIVNGIRVANYVPQFEYLVSTNCSERVRHFACALLEPECNPPPNPSKGPCHNFCREIIEHCEGRIPQELFRVFNCDSYPKENCVAAKSPCYEGEFGCGDGTCIPKEWTCDGNTDCSDGDDEDSCVACDKSEFRCQSGGCIQQRWVCDGYADCLSGEDETDEACYPRELTAAAAPAPVVAHPRAANTYKVEHDSQEILMTSDSSNNALKQNFLKRRPSPHRLTPYIKPVMTQPNTTYEEPKTLDDLPTTVKTSVSVHSSIKTRTHERHSPLENSRPFVDRERKHQVNVTNSKNETVSTVDIAGVLNSTSVNLKDQTLLNNVALLKKAFEELDTVERQVGITEPTFSVGSYSAHASPCPSGELRCVDGRCITLSQLCDGVIDCSDHSDEDNCFT